MIGDWHIETNGSECHFRVTYANTFDEPVGGLMNVLLTEDGQHYQRSDLNGGRSLVIDIGGFTTDYIAVNPGGEVDYSLARSVPIGIQNVLADFEESFRANNLQAVKDTPVLPPERVRKAIASGVFEGGGRKYPCEKEAKEATNLLLNRIAVDTHPFWKREFERLARRMDKNKAIVTIAHKLLIVVWYVLTERVADKHAEPKMVAFKLMRWSWELTEEQRGGLSSRQFIRLGLMHLKLGENLTHVVYGNLPRRIASVEELLSVRPELRSLLNSAHQPSAN